MIREIQETKARWRYAVCMRHGILTKRDFELRSGFRWRTEAHFVDFDFDIVQYVVYRIVGVAQPMPSTRKGAWGTLVIL